MCGPAGGGGGAAGGARGGAEGASGASSVGSAPASAPPSAPSLAHSSAPPGLSWRLAPPPCTQSAPGRTWQTWRSLVGGGCWGGGGGRGGGGAGAGAEAAVERGRGQRRRRAAARRAARRPLPSTRGGARCWHRGCRLSRVPLRSCGGVRSPTPAGLGAVRGLGPRWKTQALGGSKGGPGNHAPVLYYARLPWGQAAVWACDVVSPRLDARLL